MAPLAHLLFGAQGGVAFGIIRRFVPSFRAAILGVCSDSESMASATRADPALGILPPPEDDRPGRPAVMIAAHIVYGLTLGWLIRPRTD